MLTPERWREYVRVVSQLTEMLAEDMPEFEARGLDLGEAATRFGQAVEELRSAVRKSRGQE